MKKKIIVLLLIVVFIILIFINIQYKNYIEELVVDDKIQFVVQDRDSNEHFIIEGNRVRELLKNGLVMPVFPGPYRQRANYELIVFDSEHAVKAKIGTGDFRIEIFDAKEMQVRNYILFDNHALDRFILSEYKKNLN